LALFATIFAGCFIGIASLDRDLAADRLAQRRTNLFLRASGPALVEAGISDLNGEVVAGAVVTSLRTRWATCPPVAATRVAGIRTWNELGRFVKKGEKGIQILAPIVGHRRKKDEQDASTNQEAKPISVLIGFRAVYVFDHSQTEGTDLPEFEHSITGEVGEQRERLIAFLDEQNIKLEYNEKIAPALGVSYGSRIALLPGQSKAEEFTTLVHECAHLCCAGSYVA
jgi:hypothetical protein